MTQFKAGDKVRIVQSGWGIHPAHVGKEVTIHSHTTSGRYTIVETLSSQDVFTRHEGKLNAADGRSFELIKPATATTLEQIEALNETLRDVNRQRDALISKLMAELKP
ncbi:hypothetical protein CNR37_00112 [Pseudomonas phage ventosus]|uniref:Uncharacterized protein n=1 Tax=Pseudomonas phage ventosus TaxID=2048980 RepID=A0A2H4P823_9CAUD|nr:hypothetical protein CNR37_00112 [Pseudomonas phage ventosus]